MTTAYDRARADGLKEQAEEGRLEDENERLYQILAALRELAQSCQDHPELELGLARKVLYILDGRFTEDIEVAP